MLGLGSSLALGGVNSGFSLSDISGLDIWLQYNRGFDVDGSNVISQWDDQSGNRNHATQSVAAYKPTLDDGGADFSIDGNRDKLEFTAITNTVSTIFIVIEPDSDDTMTMFGNSADSDTFMRINQNANVEFRVRKGSTDDENTADVNSSAEPFIDEDTPMLIIFHQKAGLDLDIHIGGNGADSTHSVDDYGVQDGGTNTDLVIDRLGVTYNSTIPFVGRILEVAVYDSTLSEADLILVKADIASRTAVDLG